MEAQKEEVKEQKADKKEEVDANKEKEHERPHAPVVYQSTQIFELDEKNKTCVDCQKENASHVSVNQGITLCKKCVAIHEAFGPSISSIKEIEGSWQEYIYKYLELGGNTKFLNFLQSNSIPADKEPEAKYKCKAVDYYRRNLKAQVLGLGEIVKDYDNALDVSECKNVFPEFCVKDQKAKIAEALKEGGTKFTGFFKKFGEKTAEGFKKAGAKTAEGLKKAGEATAEGFKKAGEKTKEGFKKAGTIMANNFENVKGKLKPGEGKEVKEDAKNEPAAEVPKGEDEKK